MKLKSIFIPLLVFVVVALSMAPLPLEAKEGQNHIKLYYEDEFTMLMPETFYDNGEQYVPLRGLMDGLGLPLNYNTKMKAATVMIKGRMYYLYNGKNTLQVGNETSTLVAPNITKNDRMYVAVSTIKKLGFDTTYLKDTKTLILIDARSGPMKRYEGEVMQVIDTITLRVYMNNRVETVRLIGCAIPPIKTNLSYSINGLNYVNALLQGQSITLFVDTLERMPNNQLYAYVYVNGAFLNSDLLRMGYAKFSLQDTNFTMADVLTTSHESAYNKELGIWSDDSGRNDLLRDSYYYKVAGTLEDLTYHSPTCSHLKNLSPTEIIWLEDEQEAKQMGFSPCYSCQ